MKRIFVLFLAIASAISFGQSNNLADAYAIQRDGVLVGIGWSPSGGQPGIGVDEQGEPRIKVHPIALSSNLTDNDEILDWVSASLQGKASAGHYAMYSIQKAMRVGNGGVVTGSVLTGLALDKLVLPGCDVNSNERRMILTSSQPTIIDNNKGLKISPGAGPRAVKQKAWLCSNFRLSMAGLPTPDVMTVQPITVQRFATGEVDASGNSVYAYAADGLVISIPTAEAAPYQQLLQSSLQGKPLDVDAQLEYLDDGGNTLLTVSMTVQVTGLGPTNMLTDPADPANSITVYHRIKRGIATARG